MSRQDVGSEMPARCRFAAAYIRRAHALHAGRRIAWKRRQIKRAPRLYAFSQPVDKANRAAMLQYPPYAKPISNHALSATLQFSKRARSKDSCVARRATQRRCRALYRPQMPARHAAAPLTARSDSAKKYARREERAAQVERACRPVPRTRRWR